jgi:hypothetical protein
MVTLHRTAVALGGLVAMAGAWYLWPRNDIPPLVAGPISVSYDAGTARLTAVVDLHNNVFVDSQKQPLSARTQPSRIELGSKQSNVVTFTLEGDSAAAVWNGVRLMEVTIDAVYDDESQRAKLTCRFSFMGRFYPQLKQIGTVSSVTSPRACRVTAPSRR